MKKTIAKSIALVMAAVMLVCMFASCGQKIEKGTYKAEVEFLGQGVGVTYTFSGNKLEAESNLSILGIDKNKTTTGTYEIIKYDDGDLEIKIDFEEETDLFKDGTYAYSEGDGYIKIGIIKYEKVD
ncbi:MAG: hypothetical protein J6S71_02445 [Clostridia bacterium]|nr:hypothetical protein [Clostridia bacterium]